MRIIKIEPQDIAKASEMANEMGKLRNSIMRGDGNVAGFIGEIIVAREIGGVIANTYDYDVIADGITYDVKTKRCTSPPKPHYEVSVANYNTSQKCDRYIFTRVGYRNGKFGHCFILGWKTPRQYYADAVKLNKGDVDPSNNYTVRADCWNMKISDLNSVEF